MLPVPLLVILSRLNAVALRVASGESEAAPSEEEGFCRLSNMGYLGLAEFRSRACGFCFAYTFTSEDRHHAKPRVCHDGVIFCPPHCLCPEEAAASSLPPPTLYNLPDFAPTQRNTTIPFPKNLHKFYPPVKPGYLHHLGKCCTAAVECCKRHKVRNLTEHHLLTEGECVATWDGWDCFSTTAPGTHVTQSCPDYIYETEQSAIQKSQLKLLKKCGTDGSWERNVHTGLEWTDYAGCIAFDVKLEQTKLIVAVCAFFLSVLAILPALFIFTHFRSLACPSVRIHRQLLLSLLASSLIYIFNALFFILPGGPGAYMVPRNHVFCRVMFSLQLRYFRLTTYMWMFCEGWYLHRLLVAAFDDQTNLVGYYLFGWAFPLLPTLADFVLRLVYEESSKCWVDLERKHIEWVYQAPCLLSLSVRSPLSPASYSKLFLPHFQINFLLMIKIVVILVQKLQYSSTMEPTQYRSADSSGYSPNYNK